MDNADKKMWDEVEEHWERLSTGTTSKDETISAEDCAFCRKFIKNNCRGCPIYEETNQKMCGGTPYGAIEFYFNLDIRPQSKIKADPAFQELCGRERDWLGALRKKVEKNGK